MSAQLERLTTEVAESRTLTASAIALLNGLSEKIRELSTDPEAMKQLADDLDAQQQELAAALVANTPPAPEPTPE